MDDWECRSGERYFFPTKDNIMGFSNEGVL